MCVDPHGARGIGSNARKVQPHIRSQSDFYQLQTYGQSYLDGQGDVVLIYPKTAAFDQPLPVFEFPKLDGLRLWVLPFCLKSRQLGFPSGAPFADAFAVPDAQPAVEPSFHAPVALLQQVNAGAISEPIRIR